jgi:hypothetical protein
MALVSDLMAFGTPPRTASQIGMVPTAVSAAGTTQATAATLPLGCHLFVLASGSSDAGVVFASGTGLATINVVINSTGASYATAKIYCPVSGTMNNGSNGSLSLATGKTALFIQTSQSNWFSILTA